MAEPGKLEADVLTPEGRIFQGELYQLSTRTVVGEVGIRARHAPMLARLVPSELRLYETEEELNSGGGTHYAAAEGWIEVFGNRAVVLVGEAQDPASLDTGDLEERRADAERRLAEAEEGTAAHDTARTDLERAEAFLRLAGVLAERSPERAQAVTQLAE